MVVDDSLAKRNLIFLVAAHAFMGAQLPMIFVVGGLAGQSLASNVCFATLPISVIVFGSMTTAPWLSKFMQRFGRVAGFLIGSLGGAMGGGLAAYALYISSFELLLVASYFTGIYMSAQGFFRFAATDTASTGFKPRAISYVMAGGLAAAIIGPQLVKASTDAYVVPFMGVYLVVVALNVVGALLFLFLNLPKLKSTAAEGTPRRSLLEILREPRITVAILCAMVSYALMNLVMTSTPLAVVGCGFSQANAADVVMLHVIGMFLPSFFTGHLINRFGVERIMATGLIILAISGVVSIVDISLFNFFAGLFLLGIGWNFGFIGATTMLTQSHRPEETGLVQGFNDFAVFGLVTIASVSSGALMNCSGSSAIAGWTSVNIAMVPFLLIAGGALIWLMRMPKSTASQP